MPLEVTVSNETSNDVQLDQITKYYHCDLRSLFDERT